jgi:hypothetical protein
MMGSAPAASPNMPRAPRLNLAVRHDAGMVAFADGLRRPFARYWQSGFLADFGDGVRLAAFPLLASQLTRSPSAVAAITARSPPGRRRPPNRWAAA